MHGGHGTRLRPLTHTGPKQLLPIANKPMSQYCLESIKSTGITEIAIIIGGVGSNRVREYYKNGQDFGVRINYIEQDLPRGIAHAIGLCKDFIGNDRFLVFLGDNIIQREIVEFAKEFEKSDASASILLCEVDNPSRFGIADIKDGKIIKIMEKPKNPPTNLAVTGIYFLTPEIFNVIDNLKPSWRNELEITDSLQMLLEKNHKITYHKITDYWKDTGTPEDIIHANGEILEKLKPDFSGTKDNSVSIYGNVSVGQGTVLQNGVKITGPAIIGRNCTIKDNAVIGPNTSIGDNSHISSCDIAQSIVMSDCTIKVSTRIRDSIIAFNSKITSVENRDEKVFLLGEGTQILM